MITEQRVLILCDNSNLSEIICETLETWRQQEEKKQEKAIKLSTTLVNSIEEAQQKLNSDNPFDFIITRLEMPPAPDKSPTSDHLGLKFIQELREKGIIFAGCVLIEFMDTELYNSIYEIPYCEPVPILSGDIQTKLQRGLNKVYRDLIDEQQPSFFQQILKKMNTAVEQLNKILPYPLPTSIKREVDRIADIIITFTEENPKYRITYYEEGQKVISSSPQPIRISLPWNELWNYLFIQMKIASNNCKSIALDGLKLVGIKLLEELSKDPKFMREFGRATGFVDGDRSRLRIRFVVEPEKFPIALEALYDDEWKWWMLQAPITRCLGIRTWGNPLFWDKNSLNCPVNLLLIESATTGFIDQDQLKQGLDELIHVHEECDFIAKLKPQSNRVNVVIISANDDLKEEGALFASQIKEILTGVGGKECRFDIVHFAGHLVADEKNSYLVVPGPEGKGDPMLIDVEEFAGWLKKASTRLAYLSSCSSATETVVYELARRGVPAIVGFRWKVNDEAAAIFAKNFYEYLLCQNRSLEQAIVHARQQVNFKFKDDPAWASSILVLQAEDRGDCASLFSQL